MQNIRYVHGSEFSINHLHQSIEIDREHYDDHNQGIFETCQKWREKNPNVYSGIVRGERLVAYANVMPIAQSLRPLVLSYEFQDTLMSPENLLSPNAPPPKILYIASVVISKNEYASEALSGEIYNLIFDKLIKLGKLNDHFSEIVLRAISKDGEKFARNLGMTRECDISDGTGGYSVALSPFKLKGKGPLYDKLRASTR